jgi:CheY-like chemotaxis protein
MAEGRRCADGVGRALTDSGARVGKRSRTEWAWFVIGGRRTELLLVDDGEAVLELSATFLKREFDDPAVTTVADPTAELEELERAEYDCAVCDYEMLALDGLELLEQVRKTGSRVPFVLFTGKGSEGIASRAISAGVDEYLQKGGPEQYPILVKKVENLVRKRRSETQVNRSLLALEAAHDGIGSSARTGRSGV